MKSVKLMLTVIGISALVGGAYAIKLRTVGSTNYCINFNTAATNCPISLTNAALSAGNEMKYIVTSNPNACAASNPFLQPSSIKMY